MRYRYTVQWFAFRRLRDTRSSAIAERPARRCGSAYAKYSVSHHMIIKQFLLLRLASYGNQTIPSTRPSCNTDLDGRCHQQLSTTVEKFTTLTGDPSTPATMSKQQTTLLFIYLFFFYCRSNVRLCRSNIRLCCHKRQQSRTILL